MEKSIKNFEKLENLIKNTLDFIQVARKSCLESIDKIGSSGVHSFADAYCYGYDKGRLDDLDFIEMLLKSEWYEKI